MNADGAGPPDRELDDLIVQHLDGGLDAAGQRRLAALLAASADARRTLAGYLRQEGATLRLASAGLLGAGGRDAAEDMRSGAVADATRARPAPHHPVAADAGRPAANWSRPAFAAIAAGLLMAAFLVRMLPGIRGPDTLADDAAHSGTPDEG